MKSRRFRKEFYIGSLVFVISLILKQFTEVPEFISGGLLAFALCFEIIGIMPQMAYQKLKAFKKKLFNKS